jgi:hypothetical protein
VCNVLWSWRPAAERPVSVHCLCLQYGFHMHAQRLGWVCRSRWCSKVAYHLLLESESAFICQHRSHPSGVDVSEWRGITVDGHMCMMFSAGTSTWLSLMRPHRQLSPPHWCHSHR